MMTIVQETSTKKEQVLNRIAEIKADVSRGKMTFENMDWLLKTAEVYAESINE